MLHTWESMCLLALAGEKFESGVKIREAPTALEEDGETAITNVWEDTMEGSVQGKEGPMLTKRGVRREFGSQNVRAGAESDRAMVAY